MKGAWGALAFSFLAASLLWAAPDLSDVQVYPNPVWASRGATQVTFRNLTPQARLKVLTPQGRVVRDVALDEPSGLYEWGLTNDAGEPLASGVYVYVLTNDAGQKAKGKLAVVR
jgi:hypothetical protein